MTIERCDRCVVSHTCNGQVANDCLPVDGFGDVSDKTIQVVTVGLNPALNEFYDFGKAKQRSQRLPILSDYSATSRLDLKDTDVCDAKARGKGYFKDFDRNWHSYFEKLESVVGRVNPGWTYVTGTVAHIDLVACATKVRWGDLPDHCQVEMLNNCRENFLAKLAAIPDGVFLLLDGVRVMTEVEKLGLTIKPETKQLINTRGNWGLIGTLSVAGKVHPFRGWSVPVSRLTSVLRYDLAYWLFGTFYRHTLWAKRGALTSDAGGTDEGAAGPNRR